MAKKHKAPTEVTIVQEEKGGFALWIDNNWRMLAFVATGITAVILGSQFMSEKAEEGRDAELDAMRDAVISADPSRLAEASKTLEGTKFAGWADLMAVQMAMSEDRYEDAATLVGELEGTASPLLTKLALPLGPDGEKQTILQHLESAVQTSTDLIADIGLEMICPDPPAGSTRIRMVTSEGDIDITLFDEASPLHVANFLANVEAKSYDGTRFHRTIKGFMVQGGDPNSKDEDRTKWGQGLPDEAKVPSEAENGLGHSPFVLAAAKKSGDEESSQHQFYITVAGTHHLDGVHTVYGKVTSGQDVVRSIVSVKTNQQDQPDEPPVLLRIDPL